MDQYTPIENALLFTIRYYDAFSYPLTSLETWLYCFGQKCELYEAYNGLEKLVERGAIQQHHGFYFLPGKIDLVKKRAKNYELSEKLWMRAGYAARILSYLPFIEGVFINNSLAFFNCDNKSDIDFTIIATPGKIWTARLLSTTVLHLLGLRRHGKNIAGEICLSLYITKNAMDMQPIAPAKYPFFLAFWVAQNTPILNHNHCFEDFWEQNQWITQYLPNIVPAEFDYYTRLKKPRLARASRHTLSLLLSPAILESMMRKMQKLKINRSQKKLNNPKSVITTDEMLKFHTSDWKRVGHIEWEKYLP